MPSFNANNQQKISIKPQSLVTMKNDRKLDNINTLNNMITISKKDTAQPQEGGDILDLKQQIIKILS